jgi:hypothetical protein
MWMGVAAFATLVPGIFSALWGCAVIDRVGRSKTMLICELSLAVNYKYRYGCYYDKLA